MSVEILLLIARVGGAHSARVAPDAPHSQNLTALNTEIAPPWVDDPDSRGTWSILYSCVFTLVLCVWTAIHLNVPGQGETRTQQWLRKMKWVITAILAPELGAFTAWQQWWRASELCADLEGIASRHSRLSDGQKKRHFSLTYGFFVVMGGLAVDISDIHENVSRATLTPAAVLSLAEEGHFIEISDQDIQDKSKADVLAKSLVVIQVTWVFLQCISRKAAGLPLTPLEIHTLVHAACASLMFALWFRKPLDVSAPILTTGDDGFRESIALFLMRSPALGITPLDILDPPEGYVPLISAQYASDSLWLYKRLLRERNSEASQLLFNRDPIDSSFEPRPGTSDRLDGKRMLYKQYALEKQHPAPLFSCRHKGDIETRYTLLSGEFFEFGIGLSVLLTGHLKADLKARFASIRGSEPNKSDPVATNTLAVPMALRQRIPFSPTLSSYIQHWHMIELSLSEKDMRRWERAVKAFRKEDAHFDEYSFNTNKRFAKYERPLRVTQSGGKYRSMEVMYDTREREAKDYLLCYRAQNARPADLLRLFSVRAVTGYYVAGMMVLLSSLYGGVHLSLWNYDFPTRIESLLWRISAIALGSFPGILIGAVGVGFLVGIASIPFLLIGIAFDSYFSRGWSRIMRLRSRRSPTDSAERQWSSLMAFEAKLDDYPSLASSTILWLRQQLPRVGRLLLALLLSPLTIVILAFPILYVFSRIYIVVESFISLRHVPVGVYVGVGWSKYIPHF